ncbi:type II toxin-antitoxin system prevent-host-death family antitoxin [Candidatus Deferrimicrobium sp.]|jgi:prevent-host-death family protein|uniref:type II toxin-antitoxin system prevent-host-death family antitoxin n=1 Tax=Candidatus Deferrimicrobium sp. TaxID=3060586 RepID=UPI002ED9B1AB
MPKLTLTAARREIGEAVNKLVYGKEDRIILSRRGKDLAVILPISYLEILDEIEDRWLQEKAKKALKEKGEIPWAKVKKDLGL